MTSACFNYNCSNLKFKVNRNENVRRFGNRPVGCCSGQLATVAALVMGITALGVIPVGRRPDLRR